jgi:DNA-binding transcriptional LysR family regulator
MQLRGIDTNLIVALHALLVHRNVTRAGKEVRLSQSSMSHALSRLRAHFGDPLLIPVGRELVLTERAKSLVEPVTDAVARLERVFGKVEPFDPATSRRVFRIAATDNLELYVLPKLAAILQKGAPCIDVRVCALPADWVTSLQRGDIDLKLGRQYAVPEALESQDLSYERFGCVVRSGHPARSKPTLHQYLALDHLLVAPTAPPGTEPSGVVDAALAKHGAQRRLRMTVPHFLVAPFVVASSDLALTAPARLLAPFIKLLRLRRLELPLKLGGYKLSQVWAARSRDDDGHQWLRASIAGLFAPPR